MWARCRTPLWPKPCWLAQPGRHSRAWQDLPASVTATGATARRPAHPLLHNWSGTPTTIRLPAAAKDALGVTSNVAGDELPARRLGRTPAGRNLTGTSTPIHLLGESERPSMKTSWLPFRILRIVAPGAAILIGLSATPATPPRRHARHGGGRGHQLLVDCSAASNGSGTQTRPWNSTSVINSRTAGFAAGDKSSSKPVRRAPDSSPRSGLAGSPITLGAYGRNRASIAAAANQGRHSAPGPVRGGTVTGLTSRAAPARASS